MEKTAEPHSILIVKPSALGDVVQAIPCAIALRKLYPQAKISWLVKQEFVDLLQGIEAIDEVIAWDYEAWKKGNWRERLAYSRKLRQQLKKEKFDLVLDLQGLLKSAVLTLMTGCKKRYGYCEMREGSKYVTQPICGAYAQGHVVQRYLDVIRYLGAKVEEPEFALPTLSKETVEVAKLMATAGLRDGFIAIAPATSIQAKEWPLDRYGELIGKLIADGKQVALIGAMSDRDKAQKLLAMVTEECMERNLPEHRADRNADNQNDILIQGGTPMLIDFTGRTNLRQLMALLKASKLLVAGDTGPTHIAVAAEIPVVGLYGQRSPQRSGPYGQRHKVIWKPPSCAPCWKKHCEPLLCMENITVQEVYEACRQICDQAGFL